MGILRISDRKEWFVLWIAAAVVIVLLVIALAAAVNCIVAGRTCPAAGGLREMLEDGVMALLGFAGGRMVDRK